MVAPTPTSVPPSSGEASIRGLDPWTLLETSQALSREIVSSRLIEQWMAIALEHTGADSGVLILRDETMYRLAATASTSGGEVLLQHEDRPSTSADLPMTLVLQAEQTGFAVALDDATLLRDISHDEYFRLRAPRSALCVPLMAEGESVATLYLESQAESHAFTPARRALVEFLSRHVAASLRNARIHESLQEEHARTIALLGDITERKNRQEEMAQLESQLRQAERFEAVGTLAGGIAHDFNNILGAILGFGERALRTAREGSQLHHDLTNVVIAGERGRALVDRILSFSRGAVGEWVPVHVERAVREELPRGGRLPPRGHGQRVLVVDDEEALLELTTHALDEWGYQPAGFGSARAALEAFRARPDDFDVLLTDLRMPDMPGDVLIREARSLRPLLPVILVSGYVGDVVQGRYRSDLADDVLTKPLLPNALAMSLAHVLGIA